MQDWFISWVYISDGEITGRGWNIRREAATAEAADIASRYIDVLSKEHREPADGFILTAMNKV